MLLYRGENLVRLLSAEVLAALSRTHGDLLLGQRLGSRARRRALLGDVFAILTLVVVLVAGDLDVLKADGDVLLAEPEEAAGADQQRNDLAVLVGDEVVDLADRLVVRVIDRLADQIAREPDRRWLA